MITSEEIQTLARKYRINQTIIFREYLQLWFLSQLYSTKNCQKVLFKGGTALHLFLKSFRFSEDLDFTVQLKERNFKNLITKVFEKTLQLEGLSIKPKKTLAGQSFLLNYSGVVLPFKIFVSLDFSFREKVLRPQRSFLTTDFPVIFTGFIHHLSFEEILAEKVRAILVRKKGRDFFDLWLLLSKAVSFSPSFIEKKMNYYPKISWNKNKLIKIISTFPRREFDNDIRPFLPLPERAKINELYELAREIILKRLQETM